MDDMKLISIYLPKVQDDEIRELATRLSTDDCKISVSEIIRAAMCASLNDFNNIDKDILKAYFELNMDPKILTEMDPETIKSLLTIMK